MKRKFNLLFSFALLLIMLSVVKVEAKDVIINVTRDSVTNHPIITHTIAGVNPTNAGTDAEQEAAYTLAYTDTNMTIQLLNADDVYYIELNNVAASVNEYIAAPIKYLHSTSEVTLLVDETDIPELNAELASLHIVGTTATINNSKINLSVGLRTGLTGDCIINNSTLTVVSVFRGTARHLKLTNSTLVTGGVVTDNIELIDSTIKINDIGSSAGYTRTLTMSGKSKFEAIASSADKQFQIDYIGDLAQYYAFDENNNKLRLDIQNIAGLMSDENPVFVNPTTNEAPKHIFIYPKSTITFKIENGTWADGTTDPIVMETHAFANLDNSLVPTGMKANEGYIDGAWNKNIVYNELGGDYTYVYSYSPYAVVDNEECPKTGENTLIYAIVLFGSTCGIIGLRKYKKRLG